MDKKVCPRLRELGSAARGQTVLLFLNCRIQHDLNCRICRSFNALNFMSFVLLSAQVIIASVINSNNNNNNNNNNNKKVTSFGGF